MTAGIREGRLVREYVRMQALAEELSDREKLERSLGPDRLLF